MRFRRSIVVALALLAGPVLAQPASPPPAPAAAPGVETAKKPARKAEDPLAAERALFPRPAVLKSNVAFWRKVFAQYSEHQSVMHDPRQPERVYEVLDFREAGASRVQMAARQLAGEKAARLRIAAALQRAAAQQHTPDGLDDDARRLLALFAGEPAALADAHENIRSQRGLRERTREAMVISGQYLPVMEQTFADAGLPRLLTRLPFVESSFNVNAYSKVAAAGLWQFMPSSARIYMRLNHVADERRDPWASTRAAAEHLKDDYAALQDWPLAVTAYNFGRSGVLRALKETGGSSLEDLLARHRSKRFGFASRNFYAEFLAATDVERDWREHYGDIERGTLLRFDAETIAHYTPWRTLQRLSGADEETFRRLNPAYRPEVIAGKLYVPAGDAIRLPAGAGAAFRTAYAGLGSGETFARQREMFSAVKVKKGDTLSVLAKRHGVSTRTLKAVNGLKGDRVRAGQRLLIPTDGNDAPPPDAAEPARRPAQTARASSRVHRVKAGQSLSVIAARYDTTVAQLVRLNDLRSAQHIRAGMKLKVPG